MLGSIFQAYKNRGVPAQGAYALPAYAAGQAALGIVPAMERTYDQRYDQAYGDYEKAVLGQYTPPIADESQMFGKQDVVPLLIGDLVSRLSGGNGVVEQFMQGRSGLLAQRRQNKLEEQQAKMQQAALNAEVHRMRLNKAGQDRELFEGKVSRGQTLAHNRAKLLAQQQQQDFENRIKLADIEDKKAGRERESERNRQRLLQFDIDAYNNNVNAYIASGPVTLEQVARTKKDREGLIAQGANPATLQVLDGGPTYKQLQMDEAARQWQMEYNAKQKEREENNRQWWANHNAQKTKLSGKSGEEGFKVRSKIFTDIDKKIGDLKNDYAGLTAVLESTPEDDRVKVENDIKKTVAQYRRLAREKALLAKGKLTKQEEQYFRTIRPDMSFDEVSGVARASTQAAGALSGAIGNRPAKPFGGNIQVESDNKNKPPAKGNVRQVSGNTFIYRG